MLLEKVIALSAVKPATRSSQPVSSRPVSSARKTVSGFPARSQIHLGKEIIRDDPSSFGDSKLTQRSRSG